MKYIVLSIDIEGVVTEIPVIFPSLLVHAEVAKYARSMLARTFKSARVRDVSAGFYNPDAGICYGESESMQLQSRPSTDGQLIRMGEYGLARNGVET